MLRHTTEIINRRDQEVITGIFTKSPQDREQDFQSRDGKPQQNVQPITSSKTRFIGQLRMQENHLAIQLQCSNSAHQPIHKARIELIRVCKLESQLLGTTTANQERPIGGRYLSTATSSTFQTKETTEISKQHRTQPNHLLRSGCHCLNQHASIR